MRWRDRRAITRRSKALAIGLLVLSFGIMAWRGVSPWVLVLVAVLFGTVGTYVATRPEG